jgi:hypothetical protein
MQERVRGWIKETRIREQWKHLDERWELQDFFEIFDSNINQYVMYAVYVIETYKFLMGAYMQPETLHVWVLWALDLIF